MTDIYAPKTGSLPDRVLAFLEDNPDEELTRKDIAVKFDCTVGGIETALQLAVTRGCLRRARNSQAELVWSLGDVKALRERVPAKATGTDDRDPLPVRQIVTTLRPAPVVVDPTLIEVRKGVRLATPLEREAGKYDALFSKFDVGDSAEFDAAWGDTLRSQAKRYSRAHKTRFMFRETEPGKLGMERRK